MVCCSKIAKAEAGFESCDISLPRGTFQAPNLLAQDLQNDLWPDLSQMLAAACAAAGTCLVLITSRHSEGCV